MDFNTHKQFFTNESLISSMGGNVKAWQEDNDDNNDTPMGICPVCDNEIPVDELRADGICQTCFTKRLIIEIEDKNNEWIKGEKNGSKS